MTRLPLWKLRGDLTKWVLGVGVLPMAAGCVDPRADYDEFVGRPVIVKDAGTVDIEQSPCQDVLAKDLNGAYFGSCFIKATQSPFWLSVEQTVRPSSDGTTGELEVAFTPLTTTATKLSDTAGTKTVLKAVPVDNECRYRQDVGTLVVPAAANTFGRDLETTNVILRGKLLSADRSCSELDGLVTLVNLSLNDDGDVCVYLRANDDGTLPTLSSGEYMCDPSILLPR